MTAALDNHIYYYNETVASFVKSLRRDDVQKQHSIQHFTPSAFPLYIWRVLESGWGGLARLYL